MKRLFVLIVLFLNLCHLSWGQSSEDKRRIEEEKRQNLAPSESFQVKIEKVSLPDTPSDQGAYFQELVSKKNAVLSDACRAIILLMGREDQYKDPDASFDFLKEEGIFPPNIDSEGGLDAPLRKGIVAYMFAKTIEVKGGIMLTAFGLNQRYAFKELVYQGIMYPGNVRDVMSGQELAVTLMRAADYLAEREALRRENGPEKTVIDAAEGKQP